MSGSHHRLMGVYGDNIPMKKWLFRHKRQRMSKSIEKKLKISNCKQTNGSEVKCWSPNYLWLPACNKKDPKGRRMGTISAEQKTDRKTKNVVQSFAFSF